MRLEPLELDPDTGLPPDEQTLANERMHLTRVKEAAVRAERLLREALEGTRFTCAVALPGRALELVNSPLAQLAFLHDYRQCVQAMSKDMETGAWSSAECQLKEFIARQSNSDPGCFKLLKALREGAAAQDILRANVNDRARLNQLRKLDLSHPVLARLRQQRQALEERVEGIARVRFGKIVRAAEHLCSLHRQEKVPSTLRAWLTTPLLSNSEQLRTLQEALERNHEPAAGRLEPAERALLQAAGVNQTALLALMGDVAAVTTNLKTQGDCLPHNLGVVVLVQLDQQRDQTAPEHLGLAVGVWALFACCDAYREDLARQFGGDLPGDLSTGDRSLQKKVRSELELLFQQAGLAWGKDSDPASWGGRWEAECLAVNRLVANGSYAPLPWPFGLALIQFYGLQRKLHELLRSRTFRLLLRPCYGPCAIGEALHWAGDPEGALTVLPRVEACTEDMARNAPGYLTLPDPLAALKVDAAAARCSVWFNLLWRGQRDWENTCAEGSHIAGRMIEGCRELLALQDLVPDVAERLTKALRQIFSVMAEQLDKPEVYLGRKATISDGEARKQCMDAVMDFLQKAPARPWLTDCTGLLLTMRASLLGNLVDLKFAWWRDNGRPRRLLNEMQELAEQAVRDAPNVPQPNITKAEVLMLRLCIQQEDDMLRAQVLSYLQDLQARAAAFWSPDWLLYIRQLLELLQSSGGFATFLRRQMLKGGSAKDVSRADNGP